MQFPNSSFSQGYDDTDEYEFHDKRFLRHDNCPECGSNNNVAVYYNDTLKVETYYCNTPGCSHSLSDKQAYKQKKHGADEEIKGQTTAMQERSTNPSAIQTARGISDSTATKYAVTVDEGNYVFPYYNKNLKAVATKYRKVNAKEFYWKGDAKEVTLFGWHVLFNGVMAKSKAVIICEGEFSAMAAHEMYPEIPCLGVPCGAASANKFVKQYLEILEEMFERIYICFDNDTAGELAANDLVDNVILPGKGYRVFLTLYNDPNDYLLEGKQEIFRNAVDCAKNNNLREDNEEVMPVWISNRESINQLYVPVGRSGISILDKHFSFNEGEVTTVFSPPGVGKSSFARYIASNMLKQGVPVGLLPTEETPEEYFMKVFYMYYGINFLDENSISLKDREHYMWFIKNRHIMTINEVPANLDRFDKLLSHWCRIKGCKFLIIDNITSMVSSSDHAHVDISKLYGIITTVAKRYKCHVVVVSHTNRSDVLRKGIPGGMDSGYGSSAIERFSHNIISLGRKEGDSVLTARILKQRSTGRLTTISLNWDYGTSCYYEKTKQEIYDRTNKRYQRVRFNSGESFSQEESTDEKNPLQERDVYYNYGAQVQPGLSTGGGGAESVHRSEGLRESTVPTETTSPEESGQAISETGAGRPVSESREWQDTPSEMVLSPQTGLAPFTGRESNTGNTYSLAGHNERGSAFDVLRKSEEGSEILNSTCLFIDLETTNLNDDCIVCVGMAKGKEAPILLVPTTAETLAWVLQEVKDAIAQSSKVVFHNSYFDLKVLRAHGVEVPLDKLQDSMILSFIDFPDRRGGHSLQNLGMSLFNEGKHPKVDFSVYSNDLGEYCKQDVSITRKVFEYLYTRILKDSALFNYYRAIDIPLVYTLIEVKERGVLLDVALIKEHTARLRKRADEALEELREAFPTALATPRVYKRFPKDIDSVVEVGTTKDGEILFSKKVPFNPKSTDHLAQALVKVCGWNPQLFSKKTKKPVVNKDVLNGIALNHKFAVTVLEYKTTEKLATTYGKGYLDVCNPKTGRIHTNYNTCIARTGRLSSSRPNLQNVPRSNENSSFLRKAFVAPDGYKLVGGDFANFQIRILADYLHQHYPDTEDGTLLSNAFNSSDSSDPHAVTASFLDVPRHVAKTLNFTLIFGASVYSLAPKLGMTIEEAQEIMNKVLELFPSIDKLKQVVSDTAYAAGGVVYDLLGRKASYSDMFSNRQFERARADRQVFNFVIQGTEASIMRAFVVHSHDLAKQYGGSLVMQVHDEALWEIPQENAETFKEALTSLIRSNTYLPHVRLKADFKIGDTWYDTKER